MTGLHFVWVPLDQVPEIKPLTRSCPAEGELGGRSRTVFTVNDSTISFTTAMLRRLRSSKPSALGQRMRPRGCGPWWRAIERNRACTRPRVPRDAPTWNTAVATSLTGCYGTMQLNMGSAVVSAALVGVPPTSWQHSPYLTIFCCTICSARRRTERPVLRSIASSEEWASFLGAQAPRRHSRDSAEGGPGRSRSPFRLHCCGTCRRAGGDFDLHKALVGQAADQGSRGGYAPQNETGGVSV